METIYLSLKAQVAVGTFFHEIPGTCSTSVDAQFVILSRDQSQPVRLWLILYHNIGQNAKYKYYYNYNNNILQNTYATSM